MATEALLLKFEYFHIYSVLLYQHALLGPTRPGCPEKWNKNPLYLAYTPQKPVKARENPQKPVKARESPQKPVKARENPQKPVEAHRNP